MKNNRTTIDGLMMATAKIMVIGFSLITTMILSRTLSLADYGTFSTGNLIIRTATSLSIWGLLDAANYYYNGVCENREKYVNTVFYLIGVLGFVAAAVIILFQDVLTAYFHNPKLATIYFYIAFRPVMDNLSTGLSKLHISVGRARFVAFRNFLLSAGKLLIVFVVLVTTRNVDTIFLCLVLLEAATVLLNYAVLEKNNVHIRIHQRDLSLLPEIIRFCLPMGIYIQASALAQSMDVFIIGHFESTEWLAIYANCSARLPIDFIATEFLAVLIPRITVFIRTKNNSAGTSLIQNYIKLAYMTTWALGTACIVLAPQAVEFLYGRQYLAGTNIFALYIISDMLRLANISIFLSAKGGTKTLMWLSLGTLGCNLLLNYIFYLLFGVIGPAIATVVVLAVSTLILLKKSADVFQCRFLSIFDWPHLRKMFFIIFLCGGCFIGIRNFLVSLGIHPYIILIFCGILLASVILAANHKELRAALANLNREE